MTATFAELMFSALFLMFMNVGTVFAFLPEDKSMQVMRALAALAHSAFARMFPPRGDGQTTSQPELIISVRSQPVVRIAS
jgi:hypothetical protein